MHEAQKEASLAGRGQKQATRLGAGAVTQGQVMVPGPEWRVGVEK